MSKFKLDELDHQILEALIENARTPFTDIAKNLLVSAGTIHVRVKKMEEEGVIKGSTLSVDYNKMGYTFIAYVGLFLDGRADSSATQLLRVDGRVEENTVFAPSADQIEMSFSFVGLMGTTTIHRRLLRIAQSWYIRDRP